jgi:putative ABC transport system permease protein
VRGGYLAKLLEQLVYDLRYAARGMKRAPGFHTIAIATLALGIGINAAVFSVFSHVLLAPLRFSDPQGLYVVSSHAASLGDARRAVSGPDFRDLRDENQVFSGVAAVIPRFTEPWTGEGVPRIVICTGPTSQFFSVLGIHPLLGRLYTAEEYSTLDTNSLLISEKFWKEQLGSDPNVIGRTIRIGGASQTIVGVIPSMPDLFPDTDIWPTLTTEPSWPFMNWRANKFLDVIGRLKPGIAPSIAEQQLTAILRRAEGEPKDVQVHLTPLKEFVVGSVTRQLSIIMVAVIAVLLVTCLNTASLLISRAVKRAPEMAVRLGLGASRRRIRQQLLAEGLLLSVIGGVIGIALASMAIGLVRQIPGLALPRIDGLHVNMAALWANLAVVGVTSIAFAVLPANVVSSIDISTGLKGGRTETGKTQRLPFSTLIVAEVACAVVLTVCAGLLVRSFIRVQQVDLGFQPTRVVTAYLRTTYYSFEGYPFWKSILEASANLPGASAAAVSDCMPGEHANGASLIFNDRPSDAAHALHSEACWISAGYFRTLGSALLQGRFFTEHDDNNSQPVVIINADAAREFFPNESPIGKRIAVNYFALGSRNNRPPPFREIVGVVANVRQRALDLPNEPAIYVPYEQDDTMHVLASMNLFVRSAGEGPAPLARSIPAKIHSIYPNQPVERLTVMPDVISRSLARRTYSVRLMTSFAGLALLLCALGIYGVVSYVTLQRTREFGIRMALGASRQDVLRNVLQTGGSLVFAGTLVGFCISLLATRGLAGLLFETRRFDPVIFFGSVLLLGIIGLLACLVPGLKAAQLDPSVALSSD